MTNIVTVKGLRVVPLAISRQLFVPEERHG
jgi:hypothetical protein